jgi:hypothetical protein
LPVLNHVIFLFSLAAKRLPNSFLFTGNKTEKKHKVFWTVFVVFISRQLDFVIVLILDERRELEIRKTGLNRHRIDELNREFIIFSDGLSGNVILLFLCSDVVGDGGGKEIGIRLQRGERPDDTRGQRETAGI